MHWCVCGNRDIVSNTLEKPKVEECYVTEIFCVVYDVYHGSSKCLFNVATVYGGTWLCVEPSRIWLNGHIHTLVNHIHCNVSGHTIR